MQVLDIVVHVRKNWTQAGHVMHRTDKRLPVRVNSVVAKER